MLVHPNFDPVAIHLGPLAIRWYGLMYLVGFVLALTLGRARIARRPESGWARTDMDDLLFYAVLGVIIGGRLGYVLFYKPAEYLSHPAEILAVWQGGMSFHGGFLGVLCAMALFARSHGKRWLDVTDFIAPLTPLGLMCGRIGNFINGELPGRATDLPWGMVFPYLQDNLARHPSQLYEAALEGAALFVILWLYTSRPRPLGAASALFLIGYGVFRFAVEFTRQPDDFLGLLALGMSMGQWLSVPMILAGVWLWFWSHRGGGVAVA